MFQSRSIRMTMIVCTGLLLVAINIVQLFLEHRAATQAALRNLTEHQVVSAHVLVEQFSDRFDGISIETSPDGAITRVIWNAIPEMADHAAVNDYAAMTKDVGTLLLWDPAQSDFVRTVTNIKTADGKLAVGVPLGQDHPGRAAMVRKETFTGEVQMLGHAYLAHYIPILTPAGDVIGGFFVGIDRNEVDNAIATEMKEEVIGTAVLIAATLGILVFLVSALLRPLGHLGTAIQKMSDGDLVTPVPYAQGTNEVGRIAARVEEFREKLQAAQETETVVREQQQEAAAVVQTLRSGLGQLAAGDLTRTLQDPFPPQFEELRADFNATVKTLNDLIGALAQNASAIRARASEISGASENLSHRTENQAATLEETAAALDELTASVRSASQSALQVEGVVTAARKNAEVSRVVVSEATAAMAGIESSSEKITQIISVIDDIAFQTNLLALNAGVEAARAGDAGRGFAVVASEVRALAQRSSDAAKEIKTLIGTSSKQVVLGVDLVNRAGNALSDIVGRVSEIADLVSGIASAAKEQALGLEEINTGVSQLDQVTQQNAAMVEEVTAASGVLGDEAEGLDTLVARFDVGTPARNSGMSQAAPRQTRPILAKPAPQPRAANSGTWQDF